MKITQNKETHGRYISLCREISGIELKTREGSLHPEPFASLPYDVEIKFKNRIIKNYLSEITGISPEPVIASPLPRHYRTTTKRKAHRLSGRTILSLNPAEPWFVESLLEPVAHSEIYRFIESLIASQRYKNLARHLNFAICRGTYDKFTVILNVDLLDADIVRSLKSAADDIHNKFSSVLSCFAFHDSTRSPFYFESSFPDDGVRLKRMFGPGQILFKVNDITLACPPTAFSQVNLSLVPGLCDCVRSMLSPSGSQRLADLYCGYGLFSIVLSDGYSDIMGVDLERSAIAAARETVKRMNNIHAHFHSQKVDPDAINALIRRDRRELHVILDPPRAGCEPDVIAAIASREPSRVVHLFCNVERIQEEIEEWEKEGYKPVRCVPVDMFPGTPHLEVVFLLEPVV